MEAERIKKKLNGSILKGSKVSVEEARPQKKRKSEDGEPKEEKKKVKKAKGGKGVLPGVELPAGRKVVRGWTEGAGGKGSKFDHRGKKDKKDKEKSKKKAGKPSKYTKQPEVLFKTSVPPNKADNIKAGVSTKNKDKYNKNKKKGEVVVHEFAKTTKHAAFLKSNQVGKGGNVASEFVEGKGWVDEDGNVIEEVHTKPSQPKASQTKAKKDSSKESGLETPEVEKKARALPAEDETADDSSDSSVLSESSVVSSSSSEESEDESDEESSSEAEQSEVPIRSDEEQHKVAPPRPRSSSPAAGASKRTQKGNLKKTSNLEKQEGFTASSSALEALYKRPTNATSTPTPRPAPIVTSFSFFGDAASGDEENEDSEHKRGPQTPFTRQDREWRDIRSAAPTPDTAAIGKRFFFPEPDDDEEEEEDDIEMADGDVAEGQAKSKGDKPDGEGESEFSKWFWEHRGEKNRAWEEETARGSQGEEAERE